MDDSDSDCQVISDEEDDCETDGNAGRFTIRDVHLLSDDQLLQLAHNCRLDCLQPVQGLIDAALQMSLRVDPHPISLFKNTTICPINHKKRKRRFKMSTTRPPKQTKLDLQSEYVSDELYAIEAIVNTRLDPESRLLFKIKWKGYEESENTWQTVDDLQNCHKDYERYYRQQFAGKEVIDYNIEDFDAFAKLLSKTATGADAPDVAVVLKLNGIRIEHYERTDTHLQQLRSNLKTYVTAMKIIAKSMDSIETRNRDQFWPQKILIQYLVKHLNIETHFGDFRKFLEFVDNRKESAIRLKEWEDDINDQLEEIGFTGDKIWVENHVNLEVPPEIKYLNKYRNQGRVKIDRCHVERVRCKCPNDCKGPECRCALNIFEDMGFQSSHVLHECNDRCQCSAACPNRRLQKGLIGTHLAVFKTECKGWGVMSRRAIRKDSFVFEYLGEIIDSVETTKRDMTYFFNIAAEFCGQTLIIDADYYANIARFVNHSCEPNLSSHMVVFDDKELVPRIGFFANRDIKAYEELTYDYNREVLSIDGNGLYKNNNTADDSNSVDSGYTSPSAGAGHESACLTRCLCGAAKCRRFC